MMPDTPKIENPPAFPNQPLGADGLPTQSAWEGMTLRDWFAGQALAGMLPHENMPWCSDHAEIEPAVIADAAYELADALLAERQKGQTNDR